MTIHNKTLHSSATVKRTNLTTEYIFKDGTCLEEYHLNNTLGEALLESKITMNRALQVANIETIQIATEEEGWLIMELKAEEL